MAVDLDMEALGAHWRENGFAVLPKFYSDDWIEAAQDAERLAWDDPASRVVVDDISIDKRSRIRDVTEQDRGAHRFKVNDLYLEYDEVRRLALNDRMTPILKALLKHTPVLCNSLNFLHGSTQADHVDSLFMTPRTQGHLIAIWVALEDCHWDAGPLRYYPGSHRIEQYVFSTGSNHYVPEEMTKWHAYMDEQVAKHRLTALTFEAKRGDVFIWDAHLLHGGSPIETPGKTRQSIVFHYFSEEDSRALRQRLVPEHGAYWVHRQHQPVPGVGESPAPALPASAAFATKLRDLRFRLKRKIAA
jgi:phytanoyl-CoA hydroxylase